MDAAAWAVRFEEYNRLLTKALKRVSKRVQDRHTIQNTFPHPPVFYFANLEHAGLTKALLHTATYGAAEVR